MNEQDCGLVREWIPDQAAGRLGAQRARLVVEHVASCAECAAELELVTLLLASPPEVPAGLSERVSSAVGSQRRRPGRPWWGLSAAAVAAVALGIGITSQEGGVAAGVVDDLTAEFEEGEFWVSDDAMLAGAPSLEELSDAELAELLEDLVSQSPGGQV